MPSSRWLFLCSLFVAGGLIGASAIVISTEINRRTSTDAFCTSCHSMAVMAADPHFQQSGYEANAAGIRVSCSDCHIPPGNWFVETYANVSSGLRDVIAEYTHNFDDPTVCGKSGGANLRSRFTTRCAAVAASLAVNATMRWQFIRRAMLVVQRTRRFNKAA
jgi:nitrate/TMAO reductase-like tetraheme cytochrome c subunit